MNRTILSADGSLYVAVRILDNPFCIDHPYHYYVPPMMADAVVRGAFVTVPFGRGNRKQLAVVTELCHAADLPADLPADKVKPVGGLCRERLFLSDRQLALCFYLTETTLCTMGEAVRAIVPAAALATVVEYYRCLPTDDTRSRRQSSLSDGDLMVLEHLRGRGLVSEQAIKTRFGAKAGASLDRLCDRGLIERELSVKEPTTPTEDYYSLARPADEIEGILRGDIRSVADGAGGIIRVTSEAHKRVLTTLIAAGSRMSRTALTAAANAKTPQLKALVDKGLLRVEAEDVYTAANAASEGRGDAITLSEEQASAAATLRSLADTGEPRAALLYGVTGSGKTSVILSTIDYMLSQGKGVIVLLPEISLTPQMLHIFRGRYGRRVAVIHSGLSAGERWESHRRILAGDATVVVGTRSAVFSPVRNLGMIVMDEEQEHTYKSDMNPKYHARDIARFRCAHENALMLLSSATPSLESYQKAKEGKYTLITLKNRYGGATLPDVHIVDMRGEPHDGNTSPLGHVLMEELTRVQSEGNQAVLFLNRRGYSHQLVCRSCGQAVTCPRCSVAMNLHLRRSSPDGELVCHWCGSRQAPPRTCPDCGSPHLFRMGYGTQRVEEELETLLPNTPVLRMDADTTTTKSAYNDLLDSFRRHEAGILLGTQMVTKGHDFPDVTLVGVLMADSSLYLDDYRAGERTFSMITQVIGRAGRADKPGLAVIQTMNPDHDVLKLACAQDYEAFFDQEIRMRRLLQFPPFCDIVLLNLTCPDDRELQKACLRLSEELSRLVTTTYTDVPVVIFGPFEAPVYRVDNVYRMRMIVKCRLNKRARALFSELLVSFVNATDGHGNRRPTLSIDFNPSGI